MTAVVNESPLTLEAHMMWEAQQRERHEFFAGEVYAVVGARVTHDTIALNIAVALRDVLPDTSGRVFISDMQLHVASVDASFYPDVFVSCESRDRTADTELVQRHPHWVVEVLSDSTAAFDRGPTVEAFRSLETPEAHRLVENDRPHADLFVRNAEGLWALNPAGEGGTLTIASLGVELSMAAVYKCVAFEVRANAGGSGTSPG